MYAIYKHKITQVEKQLLNFMVICALMLNQNVFEIDLNMYVLR